MKRLDYIIQSLRIRKVLPYISSGSDILDIGCADGALFKMAGLRLKQGIGVDPGIEQVVAGPNYRLFPGPFPESVPPHMSFDVITMLAVFEHLTLENQTKIVSALPNYLRENGKVIMTIPSPQVDKILEWLKAAKLIDGMDLGKHHQFDVHQVHRIMDADFSLSHFERFQFGMNNLFVFTKKH